MEAKEIIQGLLGIIKGDAFQSAQSMAHVHGWRCDEDVSKRGAAAVVRAEKFILSGPDED